MIVQVKDLKPNPFRKMDKYPIDKEKIKSLKISIKNTEFWDNLLGRQNELGEIEIAYGHHRLIALKELNIEQVDIPIKDLDDITMIRIMANENMTEWSSSTSVIIETVSVAKEFLENELSKYNSWEEFRIIKNNNTLFDFKEIETFTRAKNQGIGSPTILNFLGKNWKQWQVHKALKIINEDNTKIDKQALLEVDNLGYAEQIQTVLINNEVDKKDQKEIIEKAMKEVDDLPKPKGLNKNTRIMAATEKAIEEKGYKTQKENFNKVFPEIEDKPDANMALAKCTMNLLSISSALVGGLLDTWQEIDDQEKEDFIFASKNFFEVIKNKFKGGEEWKQIESKLQSTE